MCPVTANSRRSAGSLFHIWAPETAKFLVPSVNSETADTADQRYRRLTTEVTGTQSSADIEVPVHAGTVDHHRQFVNDALTNRKPVKFTQCKTGLM